MGAFKDLAGQKFGKLIVISLGEKINGRIVWNCKCDCGNASLVRTSGLKQGIESCGKCSNNTFEVRDEVVIAFTKNGEKFTFDSEFLNIVNKHSWFMSSKGYLYTTINKNKIGLHKLITNTDNIILIDHINGDKSDNRRCNLRFCNHSTNGYNSKKPKNNTSGVKGVSFSKKYGKWVSEIQVNKKRIYLGSFENIKDAIKVRIESEIKHFGEFRYTGEDNNILKILEEVGEM